MSVARPTSGYKIDLSAVSDARRAWWQEYISCSFEMTRVRPPPEYQAWQRIGIRVCCEGVRIYAAARMVAKIGRGLT
jgi:hypothetical protein